MRLDPHLRKPHYFFNAYKYLHRYPSRNDLDVLGCSRATLHDKILPVIYQLADSVNEIFWDDRLDPYNHIPFFSANVTGAVDTVPIYVQQPQNSTLRHMLYNPKYAGTVYKMQIGIDFLGRIVLFSGPHIGLQYDGDIL